MAMNYPETTWSAAIAARTASLARRLRGWWEMRDADERYLAEAHDLPDLERRMRELDRARGGPVFVTFNH